MHQLISLSSPPDAAITQDQVNLDLDHMTFFNQYAPYQTEALFSGFLTAQQLFSLHPLNTLSIVHVEMLFNY